MSKTIGRAILEHIEKNQELTSPRAGTAANAQPASTQPANAQPANAQPAGAQPANAQSPHAHQENEVHERIVCPSCGGDVPADAARCPYCNTMNPRGAEMAYMEELEDLKEDTEELADDVQRGLSADLGRKAKSIAIVAIVIVALIAAGLFASKCAAQSEEQQELQSFQARESFRQQHFDELNRLYEAGDDAALIDYAWSLDDEPGFEALYSWKHMQYLEIAYDWEAFDEAKSLIEAGSHNVDDYVWATYAALRLASLNADGKRNYDALTAEEKQRVDAHREDASKFIHDTLQMSDAEAEALATSVEDEQGYIKLEELEKAVAERLAQLGIAAE